MFEHDYVRGGVQIYLYIQRSPPRGFDAKDAQKEVRGLQGLLCGNAPAKGYGSREKVEHGKDVHGTKRVQGGRLQNGPFGRLRRTRAPPLAFGFSFL